MQALGKFPPERSERNFFLAGTLRKLSAKYVSAQTPTASIQTLSP